MPQKIQRVPRGLNEVLSLAGGDTPHWLADQVLPSMDLLQFYGLNQLQTRSSTDPAGVSVGVTLSATSWTVLFGADGGVTLNAAMTSLGYALTIRRNVPSFISLAEKDYGGAFTAAALATIAWRAPFPLICPPNTQVFFGLNRIAGVANASVTVTAEFGILG